MNYNTLLNEIAGKDLWRLWLNHHFLHYSALHWIPLLPRWQNQLGLKRAGETAEPKVKAWASGGRAALLLCMCCEQYFAFALCAVNSTCYAALHVHIVQWYTRCCLDAALLLWMQWTIHLMLYIYICTAGADLHKSTARQSFVETNFQKDQEPKEKTWAIGSNLLLCIISGAFDLLSSKVVHLYFGFFANDIAICDQCILQHIPVWGD